MAHGNTGCITRVVPQAEEEAEPGYATKARHSASFCSKLRAACAGLDEGSTTV